jgi:magnesium-transporting ATPase (P-type)
MLTLAKVEKKLIYPPNGLSQAEAAKRLAQYGPNELAEKKPNFFLKFLNRRNNYENQIKDFSGVARNEG